MTLLVMVNTSNKKIAEHHNSNIQFILKYDINCTKKEIILDFLQNNKNYIKKLTVILI
jgi:hypothetical protein